MVSNHVDFAVALGTKIVHRQLVGHVQWTAPILAESPISTGVAVAGGEQLNATYSPCCARQQAAVRPGQAAVLMLLGEPRSGPSRRTTREHVRPLP